MTTTRRDTSTVSAGTAASSVFFDEAFFTVEQAVEKPNNAANASFSFLFMVVSRKIRWLEDTNFIASDEKTGRKVLPLLVFCVTLQMFLTHFNYFQVL